MDIGQWDYSINNINNNNNNIVNVSGVVVIENQSISQSEFFNVAKIEIAIAVMK